MSHFAVSRLVRTAALIGLWFTLPVALHAQSGATGAVEGIVVDVEGVGIPGTQISVLGTQLGALAGDDGRFVIRGVPEGVRTIRIERIGLTTLEREVEVRRGEVARLRIELTDEAVQTAGVTVVSRRGFYDAARSNTATRSLAPIINTPVSVQVVTPQLLEDQNAIELSDVYENVSGVVPSGAVLNASTVIQPHIRGFISQAFLRDGMRVSIAGSGAIDLTEVESVEVLKGPGSILYGALEPGGVVNYVTKRPLATPRFQARLEGGSFEHFRGWVDATGPMGTDRLRYRLNAAYTDAGSFRDGVETDRLVVAPRLEFDVTDAIRVGVNGSFSTEEATFDPGIQFDPRTGPVAEIDTYFGEPTLEPREMDARFVAASVEARLSDAWSLRAVGSTWTNASTHEAIRPLVLSEGEDGSLQVRNRFQSQDEESDEQQFVADLSGRIGLAGTTHDVAVGFEARAFESRDRQFRQSLDPYLLGENPRGFTPPDYEFPEPTVVSTDWNAIFVQDQIAFGGDRVHLLLTGRYDDVQQSAFTVGGEEDASRTDDGVFTGRAGLLVRAGDGFAPFVSFSESFTPQSAAIVDADGNPLDPEEGTQIEGGLKYENPRGRFSATVAAYRIRKRNIPQFDFNTFVEQGIVSWVPDVAHESSGLEFDLAGEVAPGLSALANYAWTRTEVIDSPDLETIGEERPGVPEHAARLWLSYQPLTGSTLDALRVGGGLRHVSERTPSFDVDPMFEMDSYTVFDASASWALTTTRIPLRFNLRVENLFDSEYFTRANTIVMVQPGSPRSFIVGVTAEF